VNRDERRTRPFDSSACEARHACDVRKCKDKPLTKPVRFVFAFSYIAAGRLWRPIERPHFFVSFVAKKRKIPFVSVSPFLL
jgi:hypothetical protein